MKHCFYYDESEHSRVINLSTVIGDTYYDSFLVAIVGWSNQFVYGFASFNKDNINLLIAPDFECLAWFGISRNSFTCTTN